MTPAALIVQARQWVGVPFLHQGRTRFGVDCLGFIAAVLAEMGDTFILNVLPANYGRDPQASLLEGVEAHLKPIALQPGVMLVLQFPLTPFASHVALYTGVSMIHSLQANRCVVEHGYEPPWPARTRSIWALPGVAYR